MMGKHDIVVKWTMSMPSTWLELQAENARLRALLEEIDPEQESRLADFPVAVGMVFDLFLQCVTKYALAVPGIQIIVFRGRHL